MDWRKFVAASLLTLLPVVAHAQWWESSLDLDAGFRKDSLSCHIDGFELPDTPLFKNDLKIDNVYVLEIGAKGRCIAWDCFMLKSFLYSGLIPQGDYNDTLIDFPDQDKEISKFKVQSGITVDFSLGGGFLFPFYCRNFRIGPTGGWSYNSQQFTINDGCRAFKGFKYKNRWQGPWVGVDSYFSFLGYHLDAGYEFHVPHWSAYRILKKKRCFTRCFAQSRKATRGYGNVVYLDFYTTQFFCVKLDCQLKYQYWKMTDGCAHPKANCLPCDEVQKITKATWQSLELLFGVGIDF